MIEVKGETTDFEFCLCRTGPRRSSFTPTYKILRWTDEFKALSTLGEASRLTHEGEPAKAAVVLSDLVEEFPEIREGRFRLAVALIALARYREAASQLEMVVADPNRRTSTWPIGRCRSAMCSSGPYTMTSANRTEPEHTTSRHWNFPTWTTPIRRLGLRWRRSDRDYR